MSETSAFLDPNDFRGGRHPFPEFKLHADCLTIGGTGQKNVTFDVHYDPHMRLVLKHAVEDGFFEHDPMSIMQGSIKISGNHFPSPVELFASRIEENLSTNASVTLVPVQQPFLVRLGPSATVAEAVIVNGPEILGPGIELESCCGDYLTSLSEFSAIKELRNKKRILERDCIATGTVTVRRADGGKINPETAFREISRVHQFLTFARGAYCGIGNVIGRAPDKSVAFAHLGFLQVDQFHVATGWCDHLVIKSLPQIYKLYSKTVSDGNDKCPILNTIEFYRASTIARESSTEMALVASHAALETTVHHLLKTKAGWSGSLLKNGSFHDKNRAAAKFIGLTTDPYAGLEKLKDRSKAMSNIDAFELLSIFRNRIVHQGKPFEYSGRELFEVWTMSQWLCEMFLFFWFGYRGDYNDRRHYRDVWRGQGIGPVPLPPLPTELEEETDCGRSDE